MKIYLMAKNVLVTDITSEGIKNSTLSLGVYDGNTSKNAVFVQTQSLTDNLIGITDYGLMTFNSENTNLNAMITVTADVEGHGLVSKTLSVQSCLDTVEGTELGTGGGGGGGTEYTGENGILVDNTNHVISPDMSVLAEKSDVENIEQLIPATASISNLLATMADVGGGGGGVTYTGADGILVNNTTRIISPDTTVLATQEDLENIGASFQPASPREHWALLKVANVYIAACTKMMDFAINQQEGSLYMSAVQTIEYPAFVPELGVITLYSNVVVFPNSDTSPALFATNILDNLYGENIIQFRACSTVSEEFDGYNVGALLIFYIHE